MAVPHHLHPLLIKLIDRLYGKPLVRNVLRGELVEQMILDVVGTDWRAGGDYESWDIVHDPSGTRIQVKQSAAQQSWSDAASRPSRPIYKIDARAGFSVERNRWDEARQRRCDIYIFGWHSDMGDCADHRDPAQWLFFVVRATDLPAQASIGLRPLFALADPCRLTELPHVIVALTQ